MNYHFLKGMWASMYREKYGEPEYKNFSEYQIISKKYNSDNLLFEAEYVASMIEEYEEEYMTERSRLLDNEIKLPHYFYSKKKCLDNSQNIIQNKNISHKFIVLTNLVFEEINTFLNNIIFFDYITRDQKDENKNRYVEFLLNIIEKYSDKAQNFKKNFLSYQGRTQPVYNIIRDDNIHQQYFNEIEDGLDDGDDHLDDHLERDEQLAKKQKFFK